MACRSRYLTYTPWPGQLNNTRMCFETVLVLAYLSGRALVLPSGYRREHEPEVNEDGFRPLHPAECFEIEKLNGSVKVVTQEEYQDSVGMLADDGRQDLVIPPGTAVFCFPRIPDAGSLDGARLREFAASRPRLLECTREMETCRTLHLAGGVLDPFYCFFFAGPATELECKRLVKDGVRFRPSIVTAAARIAESLGDYSAVHVRRTDFLQLYPQQNIACHRLLGNVMMRVPAGTRLYVATDESDRTFFCDLAAYYDLYFLDDFRDVLDEDMGAGALGCVEQMVCASATTFVGTRLSTFSAYITRLRGYLGAADLGIYFTDGPPGSEMDAVDSPAFSWANWFRSGYPLWGREFHEGWEC